MWPECFFGSVTFKSANMNTIHKVHPKLYTWESDCKRMENQTLCEDVGTV